MPGRCRQVFMTQDNTQINQTQISQPAEAGQASRTSATNGPGAESGMPSPVSTSSLASPVSSVLSPAAGEASCANASDTLSASALNKELRWLNRALQALSACNQALAQPGTEQDLLDQICA